MALSDMINRKGKQSPVAVTGIGMITPLGITWPECWENMLQGKSGIRSITKFDTAECRTKIGGQLPESYFDFEKKKTSKRMFKQTVQATRIIRLCSQEALADSGVDSSALNLDKCGVIIGTSGSSIRSPDDMKGPGIKRFKIIREMINSLSAWISLENGFKGPSFTMSAACASGSYAITTAADFIRSGEIDFAVAGGVDVLLTKNITLRGNFMKMLSERNDPPEKAMRPFDRQRDGWVFADGGCAVVLESYEHAMQRNADVYAWIAGHGSMSESYSLYSPTPYGKGMSQTIEMALTDACIPKEKIGYVSANGTSTIVNDFCETKALKDVFGTHAHDLLIGAHKSMIGHTIGGAGPIAFGITANVLKTQKVPPTINYEHPDPDCDLNYVPNEMMSVTDIEAGISNSFGFGGHNCVIVLTRSP